MSCMCALICLSLWCVIRVCVYLFVGASSLKKDQPLFTLRQVGYLCERLIKDHEEKIREEYEQILNTKLAGKTVVVPRSSYLIWCVFILNMFEIILKNHALSIS